MVLARMSVWHFKSGKREDAFSEIDRVLNLETRHTDGFRGYLSLLSSEDKNLAAVLTLWRDEDTLRKSEKGVFAEVTKRIQDSLKDQPQVSHYRVFSTEMFQRFE